ncbi:hypothetical protein Back2_11310 [Nocardioides baekrokdamisoli]|uniref:Lipoprotein n=1 Tax=Nocardioides baekrokdamisoli TaxID=1804624 RepID=A0A3G9J060_9ACTN|nr:hypothetical protein [Nocardioides baekrokdamisoli]BBH16844.1 hypothetical protein Back2_11310 [Nocardioides baekrokdamisoli]
MNTTKTLTATVAVVAAVTLSACGSSKSSAPNSAASGTPSKTTIAQRLSAAKQCAPALKPLAQLQSVGTDFATKKITATQAAQRLAPIQKAVADAAAKNATSKPGTALKTLSDDIANLQANPPKDPASVKQAVATLTKDGLAAVSACTGS